MNGGANDAKLTYDEGSNAWLLDQGTGAGGSAILTSAATSEWTDLGSILHSTDVGVDEIAIGGTAEATADIFLGVDGVTVFNEQSNNDVDFRIEGATDANLFFTDGSADMVGVGTSAPTYKMDIMYSNTAGYSSSSANQGGLRVRNQHNVGGSTFSNIAFHTTSSNGTDNAIGQISLNQHTGNHGSVLLFQLKDTSGNFFEAMRLTQNGMMGVNTTGPSARIDAKVDNGDDVPVMILDQDDVDAITFAIDSEATITPVMDVQAPATTTATVIDVSDADALTTGYIANFTSNSSSTEARVLLYVNNDDTAATGAVPLRVNQDSTGDIFQAYDGGVEAFDIQNGGNVTGTHGTYHTASDMRLKKDIVTIPDALEKVMKLRGVNFKWKDESFVNGKLQMGLIAQEVEEVTPEVVHTAAGPDHIKAVEYEFMVGLLIETMKEQQVQIAQLREKIEHLKSQR